MKHFSFPGEESRLFLYTSHRRSEKKMSLNHTTTSGFVTTLGHLSLPKAGNRSRVEGTLAGCINKAINVSSAPVRGRLSTDGTNERQILRPAGFGSNSLKASTTGQPFWSCEAGKNVVGETEGVKMSAAMVDTGFDKFDAVLKAAEVQADGTLLLLFLADRDSALGKSWCPDCVRAEPVIYRVVDGVEKPVTLLRVYVGDRPTWRNPEHALRKDSRFALKGVPTLIKWENGAITGRLEDHEAHIEEKVRKLIS